MGKASSILWHNKQNLARQEAWLAQAGCCLPCPRVSVLSSKLSALIRARRLDGFLEFNGNELLTGPGKISAEQAKLHAETEFEKYRIVQDRLYESDFDRFLLLEEKAMQREEESE